MQRLDPGSRHSTPHLEFIRRATDLEQQLASLRSTSPRHADPAREAARYVRQLLAHLISLSGNITHPEIDLLRLYHGDEYTDFEEINDAAATVRASRDFLSVVPGFLCDAIALGEDGRSLATSIFASIRGMCEAGVAADRIVEDSESAGVAAYLALLESELRPRVRLERGGESRDV